MKKLIIMLFVILLLSLYNSCRDDSKYRIECWEREANRSVYCESYTLDNNKIYMYDINNKLIGICCADNWYIKNLKE